MVLWREQVGETRHGRKIEPVRSGVVVSFAQGKVEPPLCSVLPDSCEGEVVPGSVFWVMRKIAKIMKNDCPIKHINI